jgi:hypothetical protein
VVGPILQAAQAVLLKHFDWVLFAEVTLNCSESLLKCTASPHRGTSLFYHTRHSSVLLAISYPRLHRKYLNSVLACSLLRAFK